MDDGRNAQRRSVGWTRQIRLERDPLRYASQMWNGKPTPPPTCA